MAGRKAAPPAAVACAIANLDEMLHLAELGLGVAVLPHYLVSEAVASHRLVRLGPTKSVPRNPVHLAWRKAAIETSRFKLVREQLLGKTSGGKSA